RVKIRVDYTRQGFVPGVTFACASLRLCACDRISRARIYGYVSLDYVFVIVITFSAIFEIMQNTSLVAVGQLDAGQVMTSIDGPLRVLQIEDSANDAFLVEMELRKSLPDCSIRCVDDRDQFIETLETFAPQLILSD